jgi:hypothetical protein
MTDSHGLSGTRSNPTPTEGVGPERPAGGERSVKTAAALTSPSRLVVVAAVAGLVAGLIAWLIGEVVVNAFVPPMQTQKMMGQVIRKATFADQSAADFKNATLAFGVLGGMMGAAMGMAGGVACRSARAIMRGVASGLVAGAILGVVASVLALPFYFHALDVADEELSRDLVLPVLVHSAIWAACGLAGGLAFGIGLDAGRTRIINAALGGLIGAALGAVLYEMIGAATMSTSKTTSPLPLSWEARLLARMLVATLSGLLAAVVVNMKGRQNP